MKLLVLLPLALVSCGTVSPDSGGGTETYRYTNSLDFGNDNTLEKIMVTGHDERGVQEATRLDVTVGSSALQLRDPYDGTTGGAMYNPSVALGKDGALLVSWSRMGETMCRSEIIADATGKLVERKRIAEDP